MRSLGQHACNAVAPSDQLHKSHCDYAFANSVQSMLTVGRGARSLHPRLLSQCAQCEGQGQPLPGCAVNAHTACT